MSNNFQEVLRPKINNFLRTVFPPKPVPHYLLEGLCPRDPQTGRISTGNIFYQTQVSVDQAPDGTRKCVCPFGLADTCNARKTTTEKAHY